MTTEEKEEPTIVLFRMFQGEVVALFPTEATHIEEWWLCSCYSHMGQHSSADLNRFILNSRRAAPDEYADLKRELEQRGYVLHVRLKNMQAYTEKRRATIANHKAFFEELDRNLSRQTNRWME